MSRHSYIPAICAYCGNPFPARKDSVKKGEGRYCSLSCHMYTRHAEQEGTIEEEFWKRVHKTDTCWLWNGYLTRQGYGHLKYRGKTYKTSRLSWTIHYGPIPDRLFVCHDCPSGDNPACVHPAHLFLGTCKENLMDASRKGRMATGFRNGQYTHPELVRRGAAHPLAKLSNDDIRYIRSRRGIETQEALGRQFHVPQSNISLIQLRKIWKHVSD